MPSPGLIPDRPGTPPADDTDTDLRGACGRRHRGERPAILESVLSFDIWGPLDLKLSLIFDRIDEPVTNADGVRPESNDLRLSAGLGLSF